MTTPPRPVITFFHSDNCERQALAPIAREAERRGYPVRFSGDPRERAQVGVYCQHACRPNAESVVYRGKVFIKAVRNIKVGDEITYHYGKDYYDAYIGKSRCRCVTCTLRRARERLARKKRAERRKRAQGKRRAAKRSR